MNKVSNCCEYPASVEGMEESGICSECGENCEYVCEDCGGTGEITVDEPVYPDEGSPTAPIGTRKCLCQVKEESEE